MEEKNITASTTARSDEAQSEEKLDKKDEEILELFNKINFNSEDLLALVNDLMHFEYELKSLKNINFFLTFQNFNTLKNLVTKENIKINLILSRIYMNIINNDSLYLKYLISLNEDKINLIIQFIDECISLIEKLEGFVFDPELFKFKTKTLSLIKCIYLNCKNSITNNIYNRKLQDLLDNLPAKFFSETFNELNKDKELFEVRKSQDQDKINNFEDKFAQINNYYEQFETFKKFVECNSGVVIYDSVAGDDNPKLEGEDNKEKLNPEKIDFYQQYGLLLLKFCKYHQYIFLNKENKDAENKEKKEGEEENENIRVVFLLDKIKQDDDEEEDKKDEEKKEEEKKEEDKKEEEKSEEEKKKEEEKKEKGNKKIENLMNEKLFISETESKEYNDLIKKEINHYLDFTKSIENEPKIKTLTEQMKYYLGTIESESYVPLYLTDFSKITISDNFTPSFLTNVPAGKTNELYLETKMSETILVYIEFSLEDKSKDITFEVNKYEINTNSFKPIFKEEKIEDTFKFFILCNGYSLYQIIFNNYYSWFTSKDVNYRIALLRLVDKPKKMLSSEEKEKEDEDRNDKKEDEDKNDKKEDEDKKDEKEDEDKKEEKEDEDKKEENKDEDKKEENEGEDKKEEKGEKEKKDNKFSFNLNGKKFCFDQFEICKNIKDYNKNSESEINIPVLLYLKNLRIVSIKRTDNEKEEIKFINKEEEDENYISKSFFDYNLVNYLNKNLKIKPNETKNKQITISIFSQNRDLSSLYEDVKNLMEHPETPVENKEEYNNYIKKIGFCPTNDIEGYKVEYKLYDLCEQSLIYHLFLCNSKNEKQNKNLLFLVFDKLIVNGAVLSDGNICTDLEDVDNKLKLSNIQTNDVNGVLDFIDNANKALKGIDLVLTCLDIDDEEKKNKTSELFESIQKYCQEKITPSVKVVIYEQSEISDNVFNYMNLFYNN